VLNEVYDGYSKAGKRNTDSVHLLKYAPLNDFGRLSKGLRIFKTTPVC
jgi:hypothetical protein